MIQFFQHSKFLLTSTRPQVQPGRRQALRACSLWPYQPPTSHLEICKFRKYVTMLYKLARQRSTRLSSHFGAIPFKSRYRENKGSGSLYLKVDALSSGVITGSQDPGRSRRVLIMMIITEGEILRISRKVSKPHEGSFKLLRLTIESVSCLFLFIFLWLSLIQQYWA